MESTNVLPSPTYLERLKNLTRDIDKHEVFVLAGSIAYTTALALAPFVVIILSVASLLGQNIQNNLYAELSTTLGPKVGATFKTLIENSDNQPSLSTLSGIIGFLLLAFSASALFTQLRFALDKMKNYTPKEARSGAWNFIKEKFLSVGLVFAFAFLSVVSLLATTAIALVVPNGEGLLWEAVSLVINFILFTLLFSAMYRFIPTEKLPWKRCWIAGTVSSAFYLVGKSLVSLYLAKAGVESSYGAAGSIVLLLVWVYYTAILLLISFEFTNDVIWDRR